MGPILGLRPLNIRLGNQFVGAVLEVPAPKEVVVVDPGSAVPLPAKPRWGFVKSTVPFRVLNIRGYLLSDGRDHALDNLPTTR